MAWSSVTPGGPEHPERFARIAAVVRHELARLARIAAEAAEALADFPEGTTPPLRELRGIGDVIHDFYTGAERIFERIAPELNGGVPAGASWHRDLLENMALEIPGVRPAVLRPETLRLLEEFLRFRHLFRNLYGFELEWPRLRALLQRLPHVWDALRSDIERFVTFLDAAARG